jgi:hypothetical protein
MGIAAFHLDAKKRYPHCTIQFVDEVAKGQPDPQAFIVRRLIANRQADAFGKGDVSNQYLRDKYGKDVPGGLAMVDVHAVDGMTETCNFITRNVSSGVFDRLNAFIAGNKGCNAPKSQSARNDGDCAGRPAPPSAFYSPSGRLWPTGAAIADHRAMSQRRLRPARGDV